MSENTTIEITPKNLKKVGSMLADIRNSGEMSQTVLAKKMKKNQSFVSNVEKAVKIPSTPTIVNYLDKLGYKLLIIKK